MNRNKQIPMLLTAVLAAATLAACDDMAPEDRENAPQTEVTDTIAAVTLADGSQFRFYEPVPGEVVVAGLAKSNDSLAKMELLDAEQPSAVALYRALTDKQAPAALVHAQARAEAARKQSALDLAEGRLQIPASPADDVAQVSSALTSAEFEDKYCKEPGSWHYTACLLNHDRAFSVDRFGGSLGCRIQGRAATTLLVHQTWYPFNWSNVNFALGPQDIAYVFTYGIFTQRKCHALPLPDGSGKAPRYDFAGWGNNI